MHLRGWSALQIDITVLFFWTVLKAAAFGVGVTMSSAGVNVINRVMTFNATTNDISGNVDVRFGTFSGGP